MTTLAPPADGTNADGQPVNIETGPTPTVAPTVTTALPADAPVPPVADMQFIAAHTDQYTATVARASDAPTGALPVTGAHTGGLILAGTLLAVGIAARITARRTTA